MRSPCAFPPRHRLTPGFTLVELVVVVSILALLSGVLIPVIGSEMDNSRRARATTDIETFAHAFAQYRAHTGFWPHDYNLAPGALGNAVIELRQFECLYQNTHNHPNWKGPYLSIGYTPPQGATRVAGETAQEGVFDPWGHAYRVSYTAAAAADSMECSVAVFSVGPNGVLETSDANLAHGDASGDDIVILVTPGA